jgi:hypothetical protein
VLISDNSLDMQHSALKKFAQQFHGPYVVTKVHDNVIYSVRELNGTEHRLQYAGKRVNLFKLRIESTLDRNSHEKLKDIYYTSNDEDET